MGAVAHLIVPEIPIFVFCVLFTALLIFAIIRFPYHQIAAILKWLCLVLLLNVIVPFLVKADWMAVLKHTFVPEIRLDKDYIQILVAILGTTISLIYFSGRPRCRRKTSTKRKHRLSSINGC